MKRKRVKFVSKSVLLRAIYSFLWVLVIALIGIFLYLLLPSIQSFYQDIKNKATYQIGLDVATSASIMISAFFFVISFFRANKRMEQQRVIEERTSMRVQKMFEINSKVGDSIVKIISALRRPPSSQTDKEIAGLLNETSLLLDTFLFNLGAIGTEEQVDILIEARSALRRSVTRQGGETNVDLEKLRNCLLSLQKAIMTDARTLLTTEDVATSEKTIADLLEKVYGN